MAISSDSLARSYVKTAAASGALVVLALLLALLGLNLLPKFVGPVFAALALFVALVAATFACASAVVLVRYDRAQRGKRDLFLALNRSREAGAILAADPRRVSRMRRWLAQRFSGHELVVGDLVEIRPWAEIRATLDEHGCLEALPFMPEMVRMCGQRARVFRNMHRLFDYRKTRRMRQMDGAVLLVGLACDGSSHGNCEAACHTIWKSAWLRRLAPGEGTAGASRSEGNEPPMAANELQFGTQAPRYVCQLTQLNSASKPIERRSVARILLPLISGNVAPAAFVVGWLTHLFNELQHHRQGVSFPAFEQALDDAGKREELRLQPGDRVVVNSSAEIRATLNDQFMHRGLWFEPDMMKHCGHRYEVRAEIRNLIDIVTGEMLVMKTPAYVLRDVHFSGERQLFNSQYEPLFWRAIWLRRDPS